MNQKANCFHIVADVFPHLGKDCPPALPDDFTPPAFTKMCDIITDQEGPLADCTHRVPDFKDYHNDCVYDMFHTSGEEEVACDIITNYVAQCQNLDGQIKEWRTEKFCRKSLFYFSDLMSGDSSLFFFS